MVALSNGSTIQTSYAYDPYGVTTSAGAATTNTYQFTARENDGTTAGLMFYRARYYNPAWGRFESEDPIGVAGEANLYRYTLEQATVRNDPFGFASGPINFGPGYTGRLDPFNSANGPSFENTCMIPMEMKLVCTALIVGSISVVLLTRQAFPEISRILSEVMLSIIVGGQELSHLKGS